MKFVRRATKADFLEDQTITIPDGGGSDDVTNIPKEADTAIEVELDDGTIVVLLGYTRK